MSNNEVMKLEEDKDLKGEFKELCKALRNNHRINPNLYVEYDVKRGLRDSAGKGVLTGLTEVSDVTDVIFRQRDVFIIRESMLMIL